MVDLLTCSERVERFGGTQCSGADQSSAGRTTSGGMRRSGSAERAEQASNTQSESPWWMRNCPVSRSRTAT